MGFFENSDVMRDNKLYQYSVMGLMMLLRAIVVIPMFIMQFLIEVLDRCVGYIDDVEEYLRYEKENKCEENEQAS